MKTLKLELAALLSDTEYLVRFLNTRQNNSWELLLSLNVENTFVFFQIKEAI